MIFHGDLHVAGCRSSLATNDELDGCTCQSHQTKEPLLCSYRTPMILEDLSCYSSPLHPSSRHCQQMQWLDTDLTTQLQCSPVSRQVAYSQTNTTGRQNDETPVINESTSEYYCSSECPPGSPCAVCRLLGPSGECEDNKVIRQRCKVVHKGASLSPTPPCDTPLHHAGDSLPIVSTDSV